MKICIISNLFPHHIRGGAERVADRIARALVDRGHNVVVISTHPEAGEVLSSKENKMLVYRFRPKNLYYILEDQAQPFWKRAVWHLVDLFGTDSAKQVSKILQKEQPDLVFTHNLKGIGLTIPRAIRKANIPHLHLLHDVQLIIASGMLIHGDEGHWMNKGRLQEWYQSAARRALGSPNVILSPSKFLLDYHVRRGFFPEAKTVVLPNPAPEFGGVERQKLKGPLRLLFLGSLEEHKGLTWLMDTLRPLEADFELTVAGKGSLEARVKNLATIDQRFKFFGPFDKEEEADMLGQTDCLIVPSLCYENSPTVIYESLSCGVPVVASNIGGVPELIHPGENGYLFEPGNGADLLEQLQRVAEERKDWYKRSDQIRMSMTEHAMTHYLDRLERLMKTLLR
jgi:glycosyltransferase involved in cell wall biosynthesis